MFHFTPDVVVFDRQTDKLRYISSFILDSTKDRRTTFNFTPHYWIHVRHIDGQITLHFTLQFEYTHDEHTDKLRFISPLKLEFK